MSGAMLLFQALFACLLLALLVRSPLIAHALIGGAAVAGLVYGFEELGPLALTVPFVVLIVAAVQVFNRLLADRAARFTPDEDAMLAGPLTGLGRAQARKLLDQGLWLDGRPGDTLTAEGEKVGHLYYLASGEAEVHSGGTRVGAVGPRQLIGEATVLSPDPATATVRLTAPSRFWCAEARKLSAYLGANPEARHALEHGFTLSLKDKLDAMNRLRPKKRSRR